MRSSLVVKIEISTNRASRLTDGFVGSQIDLLVFDAFPKPLDEYVVSPSSFAIHADGDAVVGEDAGEGPPGELRALVGVVAMKLRFALRCPACRDAREHLPTSRRRRPPPS